MSFPAPLAALVRIGVRAVTRYAHHNGELLAAALAFYGMLSLAPLMLLATMGVGLVFEASEVRSAWLRLAEDVATERIARNTVEALDAINEATGQGAATIALVALLLGASRLFVQLQIALNAVWGVQTDIGDTRQALRRVVGRRLLAFAMVAGAGLLLMLLVILNAVLAAVARNVAITLPFLQQGSGWLIAQNFALAFVLLTLFCLVIYRVLPDERISFRDALVGALLTALLMLAGTVLLSMAIGALAGDLVASTLGSAAALVVWLYYESQVFLLAAAVTRELSGSPQAASQATDGAP